MIALRRTIERGVRHPLLGPLCLILLALLLVFTIVHGAHDQIHDGELIVCIAFLLTALMSLVLPQLPSVRVIALRPSRAPPAPRLAVRPVLRTPIAPIPLRL